MIKSTIKILPKSTLELEIKVSSDEVKKAYEGVIEAVIKNSEIKGFRKGKAPRDLVEKEIDKGKVYQEVLQTLLPKAYFESVKEHNINPVVDPKIELVSPEKLTDLEKGQELIIKAITATRPKVALKNYKEEIKKLKAKESIWIPGKGDPQKKDEEKKGPSFEELLKTLLESTEVELSDILIESEANKLLSQTLDEIKRLGLTLDQYLSNTRKTIENLKSEASRKAITDLKLEFILTEIAKDEKLSVLPEEIDKVIEDNKDPKIKEQLRSQKYLLSSIILQQKTLDFVKNL